MEPVFSDWLTGTLSDEGWGPRDDKIVQFASHYFLYFPIFHLKYSYIFPIFCPSEFLYSYFFFKKVTGRPALNEPVHSIERHIFILGVLFILSNVFVRTSRITGFDRCLICHSVMHVEHE